MNSGNTRKDFKNVLGLGEIDYSFNLNLTEKEALLYKFDINQTKSIKDCKNLLQTNEIKEKIMITSKNNLINLMLFINKTNPTKSFTEFLSLNCLILNQDFSFLKEKISSQFDDNFLFLIESNILPPCKFKLNIQVGDNQPKTFVSELNESSKVMDDGKDVKKNNSNDSSKENEENNDSKNNKKTDENKKVDENKKTEENKKNEDSKKQDPNKKPKAGNTNLLISEIKLPGVSKPSFENASKSDGVEGNHNLLNKIVYDFNICDYLFIDLNKFINYNEISINDLYDFIYERIIHQYTKTKIIMIFPGITQDFNNYNTFPLIDLISLADIIIFDKRDALKLTEILGYKSEEKNFEVRFMFLKELRRAKIKPHRTFLFLEDFNKLSVLTQENETSLIIQHNEFNFDVGFRVDYFKVFTNHYDFLKFVFYGGFFSKIIQGRPFEEAFSVGKSSFLKLLDILQHNLPITDDPEYFIVPNVDKPKKENSKILEKRDRLERNKVSRSRDHKRNDYSSASPSRLNSSKYIQNPNNLEEESMNIIIDAEQKRLMTILNANQKLQEKINQLINSNGMSEKLNFNPSKSMIINKKLPNLNLNESAQLSKISNYNKYSTSSYGKKRSLKPISRESYGRLMGYNSQSFERLMDNPTLNKQGFSQEELKNQMKIMNLNNQSNLSNSQNSEKKPDSSKKKIISNSKSIEDQFGNFMKQIQEMNTLMMQQKQIQQNQTTSNNNNSQSKSPVHHRHIERQKREMFPVCNLGYIPKVYPEFQRLQNEIVENKKKFKDQHFWDEKHMKNKFKYLEKHNHEMNDLNKSTEEKGHRADYDDLNRSMERQRRKQEEEENRKKLIEQEKKERQEREEREKKEKERKIKEQKEKEQKEREKEVNEAKKPEEKKEEAKKPDETKKV